MGEGAGSAGATGAAGGLSQTGPPPVQDLWSIDTADLCEVAQDPKEIREASFV